MFIVFLEIKPTIMIVLQKYAVEGNQTLENDKFVTSTLTLNEAEEKLA